MSSPVLTLDSTRPMTQAPSTAKATQQQTKAHNDSLVLSTIYDAEAISRAAIARHTGLSRTSVGEAVGELLERGLVEEIGRGHPSGGKPPILLQVKGEARHVIGVDLSGSEFRGAVYNLRGEVRHAVSLARDGRSGEAALELVYELLDRLVGEAKHTNQSADGIENALAVSHEPAFTLSDVMAQLALRFFLDRIPRFPKRSFDGSLHPEDFSPSIQRYRCFCPYRAASSG